MGRVAFHSFPLVRQNLLILLFQRNFLIDKNLARHLRDILRRQLVHLLLDQFLRHLLKEIVSFLDLLRVLLRTFQSYHTLALLYFQEILHQEESLLILILHDQCLCDLVRFNDIDLLALPQFELLASLLATRVPDTHSYLRLLQLIRIAVINVHHSVVHGWLLEQRVFIVQPAVRRRVVQPLVFKVDQSRGRCFTLTLGFFLKIYFHNSLVPWHCWCDPDRSFVRWNIFLPRTERVLKLVILMRSLCLNLHSFVNPYLAIIL